MGILRRIGGFVWPWIIKPTILLVFGQALLRVIHEFGRYPERWMAEFILAAPSVIATTAFGWALAALFSALLLGVVELSKKRKLGISKGKQTKEPKNINSTVEPSPLISLVELLKEAKKQGWQFTTYDSQHIFDFASALRDAGFTETIQFWGRKEQRIGGMVEETPPTRIGSGYWETCWIRGLSCLKVLDGMSSNIFADNSQTITESPNGRNCLYKDIQLDRKQALSWLQHQAPQSLIDTSERPRRIPLNEFCELANSNGWDIGSDSSFHHYDISKALKSAGFGGGVQLWGKKGKDSVFEQYELLPIPREYWEDNKINGDSIWKMSETLHADGVTKDNTNIVTESPDPNYQRTVYIDIHINKQEAWGWLKKNGAKFKGRTQAQMRKGSQ